jgi:hypothetical protein
MNLDYFTAGCVIFVWLIAGLFTFGRNHPHKEAVAIAVVPSLLFWPAISLVDLVKLQMKL